MKVTQINRRITMAQNIEFYFDFSSSYSYLALPGIRQISEQTGAAIDWKPIALGAIFKSLNHAPSGKDSPKGRYIFRDIERSAKAAGIPYQWPSPFPYNSMTAARAYWHLATSDPDNAALWVEAIFNASFGQGQDCSDSEVLAEIAGQLGLDGQALLAACELPEVKNQLKSVTAEAAQRGVFGAPTFFVGDEMFWGSDRLAALADHLATTTSA